MRLIIDSNYIQLEAVNLRQFKLYTDSEDIVIKYDEENYIDTLIINDKFRIKLGEEWEVEGIKYKVNLIRRDDDCFYCVQERATKTSQFIMPLLGGSYEDFDYKNTFYNCYISEDYKHVYLVYKFKPTVEYLELEGKLTKNPLFVELTDPDPTTVVVKFRLPDVWYKDVVKIMKGKYSDIHPTFKSKICIFHKFSTNSKTFRMLHRDVTLRKEMSEDFGFDIPENIELMSLPIKEKEQWNYQNILKKVGTEV